MNFRASLGSGFTRARSRSTSACPPNAWRSCGRDTGTLQYEIYFTEDQSECIVLERYRDSESLIEHASNLGDLAEAILATGEVSGELLGEPSPQLRENLADGPVRLFTPFLSM